MQSHASSLSPHFLSLLFCFVLLFLAYCNCLTADESFSHCAENGGLLLEFWRSERSCFFQISRTLWGILAGPNNAEALMISILLAFFSKPFWDRPNLSNYNWDHGQPHVSQHFLVPWQGTSIG